MKLLFSLMLLAGLVGCADMKFLENRVVCTVAKDEAHVVSKWGSVGFASKIAEADRQVICK